MRAVAVDHNATMNRRGQLLVAAHLWSAGKPIDSAAVAGVREAAMQDSHRRYLATIPSYAQLAQERGVGAAATMDHVRAELIVTDEWFKSYDPAWLAADLPALTQWLGAVSTFSTDGLTVTSTDSATWREEMKTHGMAITFSSGTGGYPSVIPRDQVTLAALRASCGVRLPWALAPGTFDCLLFTQSGMGLGIQSGAAGLAEQAANVARVSATDLDVHLDADDRRVGDGALLAAVTFLRAAVTAMRPVLLYGPPSGVAAFVAYLSATSTTLGLPAGSSVVTGGGWKDQPAALETTELFQRQLGVEPQRCVDTFSCAELNTVFVTCPHGRYHVPPVVEAVALDQLLRPILGEDVEGRLAVLDPFAHSYPGFFTTGDVVRLRRDPCPCGLVGTTLVGPILRAPDAPARGCGVVAPAAQ